MAQRAWRIGQGAEGRGHGAEGRARSAWRIGHPSEIRYAETSSISQGREDRGQKSEDEVKA